MMMAGLFLMVCLTAAAGKSEAAENADTASYSWGQKLGRGALNIVSSPVEIARQIHVVSNEDSLLAGWTLGVVKGAGYGVLRLGAGLVDLVTFPFGWPKEGKRPLMEPEFVWENTDVAYA